jgi:DME family drug/metabolite transporter
VRQAQKARLDIVLAALLFSTGGAAIKGTGFAGLHGGIQVACLRSGVAAIAIALMIPGSRRGWTWRTLVVGAAYAATLILFVAANKLTTSASAIFLQDTAPLYVLLAGPLLLHERVRRVDLIFMAVLMAGLSLFIISPGEAVATAPHPLEGNILALVSGIGWAASLVGLRWLARSEGGSDAAAAATVSGNLLAFLACLPFTFPVHGDGVDWVLIVYLGVVQIGLAYVFLTKGVRYVPAFEVALLLFVEPALNPVWTWLIHGEKPSPLAILGGVLILGATALKLLLDWRMTPRPAAPATAGDVTEVAAADRAARASPGSADSPGAG